MSTEADINALEGQMACTPFINVPDQFIEALHEGNLATAVHNAVHEAIAIGTGVTALHEDMQVKDLEAYLPHRRRQRGTFATAYVQPFCQYAQAHADKGATVFVDASEMTAHAALDLGSIEAPGHVDHHARLQLKRTAAFDALLQFSGRAHAQKDVAEFFEDWAPHVSLEFFHGGESITIGQALAAVRRITIESARKVDSEEQQLSANRTAFESVQATSKDPLPTTIYVRTKAYPDLGERLFVLRLSILTDGTTPRLSLRIQNLEQHTEELGRELSELVSKTIGGALPVLLGKYSKAN